MPGGKMVAYVGTVVLTATEWHEKDHEHRRDHQFIR